LHDVLSPPVSHTCFCDFDRDLMWFPKQIATLPFVAHVAVLCLSSFALATDVDLIFDRQVKFVLSTTTTSSSRIQQ
jgi:hypothetical protein